jgi:hypothetical protein
MKSGVEAVEQEWMSFDEASAFLAVSHVELARILLAGTVRFEVAKRSPNDQYVLRMDLLLSGPDLREFQRQRWDPESEARADDLVNRAAMKFGRHPTRTSPGVRGKSRPKEVTI